MTAAVPPIKIHVVDPDELADLDDEVSLTDVGLVNINGERHLFLSLQPFESAVRQVSSVMPELPLEQVERLVREHCAELGDFDELLGPIEPATPIGVAPLPAEPPAPRPRRGKKWAIAVALVPALAGSWALGHFTSLKTGTPTAASAPDATPSGVSDKQVSTGPEPFSARDFLDFSKAGKIDCTESGNLEAECTDADGMVMSTKAAIGPDSTIFTFSYGPERLGLRIFKDAEYADTWARQDGSQASYDNLIQMGRYVLWGTDQNRLQEYVSLLKEAAKTKSSTHVMGGAQPLPPRLAALALGTLGVDEGELDTMLASTLAIPVTGPLPAVYDDEPVLMAVRAVLGIDAAPAATGSGDEDDIVALAAGLDPRDAPNTAIVVPIAGPTAAATADSGMAAASTGATTETASPATTGAGTSGGTETSDSGTSTEETAKDSSGASAAAEEPATDTAASNDASSEPSVPVDEPAADKPAPETSTTDESEIEAPADTPDGEEAAAEPPVGGDSEGAAPEAETPTEEQGGPAVPDTPATDAAGAPWTDDEVADDLLMPTNAWAAQAA
ncbi:hypothetical protein [Streptomyces sp. BH055]|uniref:hypothetical protein n=1 Tax=unclassified Streptomyces TaxID=2593676 RepID=UPI003BB77C8D